MILYNVCDIKDGDNFFIAITPDGEQVAVKPYIEKAKPEQKPEQKEPKLGYRNLDI